LPYAALCLVNLAGLGFGIHRLVSGTGDPAVLGVNLAWVLSNLVLLGATAAVAWETRQVRAKHRVPVALPAMLRLEDGRTVRCATHDISLAGARLRTSGERTLPKGERLHVSIFAAADEVPLPAEVVHHDGAHLRLRFCALGVEEESHLVRTIFSRADAWLGWSPPGRDRPVRALFTIVARALATPIRFLLPRRAHPGGAA
jgi:cellulose synthase (UDP-forming)